ncbi:MAG: hypothetical protein U1C49_00135 [Candidatus Andersenbacteria bacterium]|nr:hypothetical protein [bacterium]MDZ4225233.1 hypothetical protein [Candidatus Andersenbacteria bacterium]
MEGKEENKRQTPEETEGAHTGDGRSQLPDLERQLYARQESSTMRQREDQLKQLGIRRTKVLSTDENAPSAPVTFKSMAEGRAKKRRQVIVAVVSVLLLVVLFAVALAGTLWYRARHNVTADQIGIAIEAPSALAAGDEIKYVVDFANNSLEHWQNVVLIFDQPVGFTLSDSSLPLDESGQERVLTVGELKSGEERKLEITGYLLGEINTAAVARAEITITPENFPSGRFAKAALATTNISTVPLDLAADVPNEARQGERVPIKITVTNTSTNKISGAYLKLQVPPGAQLALQDPQFSADFSVPESLWRLEDLEPLDVATREAVVFVEGRSGDKREIRVETGIKQGDQVFVQRTLAGVVSIASSTLSIDQYYNNTNELLTVKPEDKVKGVIKYVNTGTVALTDVVVRAKFEGQGLDPASLQLSSGAYDPTTKTITWTAASMPELAAVQPNQAGEISYQFDIQGVDVLAAGEESRTSNALIITASVDSPSLTVTAGETPKEISDRAVLSVATALTIQADAFYDDGRLGITSTGPTPPKVGEETTYTVRLRLGSTLNDAGDVRVSAVLPDGVRYTGKVVKTTGEVEYNDRTGELIWRLPQLAGLAGSRQPAAELYWQVAVVPGENQRGSVIEFLNRLTAMGTDLFTNSDLETEVTSFPSTESAVPGEGKVE